MAVEDGMDGTRCRRFDHRELLDQFVTDLGGTPGAVSLLDSEDRFLNLERCFIRMSIRAACAIFKTAKTIFLVPMEYLVAGFSRDPEFAAENRHFFPVEEPGNK